MTDSPIGDAVDVLFAHWKRRANLPGVAGYQPDVALMIGVAEVSHRVPDATTVELAWATREIARRIKVFPNDPPRTPKGPDVNGQDPVKPVDGPQTAPGGSWDA